MADDLSATTSTVLETGNGVRNVPSLVAKAGGGAQKRFIEFFAAQIRNRNTREACIRAVVDFFDWAEDVEIDGLLDIEPVHVAALRDLSMLQPSAEAEFPSEGQVHRVLALITRERQEGDARNAAIKAALALVNTAAVGDPCGIAEFNYISHTFCGFWAPGRSRSCSLEFQRPGMHSQLLR